MKIILMPLGIELINKKQFVEAVLNKNFKVFLAFISSSAAIMKIYLARKNLFR